MRSEVKKREARGYVSKMKDNVIYLFVFLFFELLSIVTRGMLRPC